MIAYRIASYLDLLNRKPEHKPSIIDKALKECHKGDLMDLPAAVHQVLLFSDKNSHPTALLVSSPMYTIPMKLGVAIMGPYPATTR